MERTTEDLCSGFQRFGGRKQPRGPCVTHLPELPALSPSVFLPPLCTAGACQACCTSLVPLSWPWEPHTDDSHVYRLPPHPPPPPAQPARRRGDTPRGFPSLLDAAAPLRPGLITVNKALLGPAPTAQPPVLPPGRCLDEIGGSLGWASPTASHQCKPGLVFFHRAFIIIYLYHYFINDYFAYYCIYNM